nr:MAG TPA: hypothetical protein [Caudoviricetes sp.]
MYLLELILQYCVTKVNRKLQNIAKDMLTIAQLCNIVKIRIAKLRN